MSEKSLLLLFAAVLGALGISAPVSAVLGGVFLSIAASYLAMVFMPERTRQEVYGSVFSALMFGWLTASLHSLVLPELSLQVKMAFSGFVGRWVVAIFVIFLDVLKDKAKGLSEKFVEKVSDKVIGKGSKDA